VRMLPIESASEHATVCSVKEPQLAMDMDFQARTHGAQRRTHFARLRIVAAKALNGLQSIPPMLLLR